MLVGLHMADANALADAVLEFYSRETPRQPQHDPLSLAAEDGRLAVGAIEKLTHFRRLTRSNP